MFRASRALTLGLPAAAALGMVLGANAPPVPTGSSHVPAGLAAAIRRTSAEPRPTALVRAGAGAVARLGGGAMAKVTPDGGLQVRSGGASFGLRPVGIGRARLTPTRPGVVRLSAAGTRDDIAAMSVWYRSGRWGLEQGFAVAHRPAGTGALRIVMRTGGSMVARLTGPGAVSLRPSAARAAVSDTLTYGGLAVTDVRGRHIPAHLDLRGSRLQIVVSDSAARYPLTVDPTLAQQQELTGSDTLAGDSLGQAVAISGDGATALVGAPARSASAGVVYVFTRAGSDWTQQQELTAADGAPGDHFGGSVALSDDGSTALIGANTKSAAAGAAYVFTRSGTTWTQQQELTGSDTTAGDHLGVSVAVSGDGGIALLGAAGWSSATGAAYVFSRSGTTWTQQQRLAISGGAAGDRFGTAAALSGDGSTALVGAPAGNSGAGAAYAFTRAGTTWAQQQELTASDGAAGDRFGGSVAL
jgi:trimeric autotransporter adhesin